MAYYANVYHKWSSDPMLYKDTSVKVDEDTSFIIRKNSHYAFIVLYASIANIIKNGNSGIYPNATCGQYIRFYKDKEFLKEFRIESHTDEKTLIDDIFPKLSLYMEQVKTQYLLNRL